MNIANVTQVRMTRTPSKGPTITPTLCFISSFRSLSAINNSNDRLLNFRLKKIKTVITRIKSITVPLLFGMQKRRSFYVLLEIPCKFIITKKLKVAYKLRYILLKKINFQIFKEYFQFKKKYTHLTYVTKFTSPSR